MKKIWLLLLLLPFGVSAQSYLGYLGKKNVVALSALSGLSTFSQYGRNYSQYMFRPTISMDLAFEHCLKKSRSVGANIQYTGARFNTSTIGGPWLDPAAYYFPKTYYQGTCKLSLITLAPFIRKYLTSTGGMAPNGIYTEFGICYNKIIIGAFEMDSMYDNFRESVKAPQNPSYWSINAFIGKHHISNKRHPLYYDIGLGFNLSTHYLGQITSEVFDYPDMLIEGNYPDFQSILKTYFTNINYCRARFGVGYLF